MQDKSVKLGTLLLQYGLISEDDLSEGLNLQKLMGLKLGETLVKIGKISEENVQWILSKQFDIPFIIIEHVTPDRDLILKLPKNFLIENRILPLFETDDEVCIVTEDMLNYSAFSLIENTLNKKVSMSIGEGKKIEEALIKFYKKDATPSLLNSLENIFMKIKGTSFYRVDIIVSHHTCDISIYGSGIYKKMVTINNAIKKEDVFKTLDFLQIPFLYDIYESYSKVIFCIYPLLNNIKNISSPAIFGVYGLIIGDYLVFSDTKSANLPNLMYSDEPVYGYPYICLKNRILNYDKVFYTPDSAPKTFRNYYLQMFLPQRCGICDTEGCEKCNELGYFFKKVEGLYDSDDLQDMLKGV